MFQLQKLSLTSRSLAGVNSGLRGVKLGSTFRATTKRHQSDIRASPAYYVYGEKCMMGVRLIPPSFRIVGQNNLVVDAERKGRMLLEFTPRSLDGALMRDHQIRIGLSAEELGLILDQLPEHDILLSRRANYSEAASMGNGNGEGSELTKVLRIEPGKAKTTFLISVAFEQDGEVIQRTEKADTANKPIHSPMELTIQLGEYRVIREIMKTSIPHLVGWTAPMDIMIQGSVNETINSGRR